MMFGDEVTRRQGEEVGGDAARSKGIKIKYRCTVPNGVRRPGPVAVAVSFGGGRAGRMEDGGWKSEASVGR